ncbi:zinc transporter ZIP5 isoform 1-T4 [Anomaloglossus baeobatrachus]|uniref:zinc transporter ZIP5 n=1 Tax=Anomaloglossus baeobatrachus TaxID=238106 RepID=UPI003F506986
MQLHKAWLLLFSLWMSCPLFACLDRDNIPNIHSSGNQSAEKALQVRETEMQNGSYMEEAEKEQGYYLKQLFHLYGENDTLTYEGLTLLLKNLGLGEVQVVEIHHRELGHDHVSHLDILDVQEKKHIHVHSASEHQSLLTNPEETSGNDSSDTSLKNDIPHPVTKEPETRKITHQDRKRVNVKQLQTQWQSTDILQHLLNLHQSENVHQHEDCLNVTQLLLNFGLGWVSEITPQQFTLLCPALLYQIDSRVCIHHSDHLSPETTGSQQSLIKVLGWGALAITMISAPSLLAVACVPLLRRPHFRHFLRFLVALAVGTLCGDALLHLLPHAQEDPSEDKLHSGSHSFDAVFKGLSVLGGIYVFFLVENLMGLLRKKRKSKKKCHQVKPQIQEEGCTTALWEHRHSIGPEFCEETIPVDGCEEEAEGPETSGEMAHSHHGHSHSTSGGGLAEIVWMVLLGDGIHNLTDGLAIGAAFSVSFSGGLSTTVAVFCHELPHELGDFAVLLQTGFRMRKVLCFSLISALLSYLGMVAGAIASQRSNQVTPWIFAATAGIFLYVALVDMLPQMMYRKGSEHCQGMDCILHCIGFLFGCGIMLCIALFQEQMVFLQFWEMKPDVDMGINNQFLRCCSNLMWILKTLTYP